MYNNQFILHNFVIFANFCGVIFNWFTSDCHVFGLLLRLTNAFAYYGIVLVTTELFQVDDVCSGTSVCLSVCLSIVFDEIAQFCQSRGVILAANYSRCHVCCRSVL